MGYLFQAIWWAGLVGSPVAGYRRWWLWLVVPPIIAVALVFAPYFLTLPAGEFAQRDTFRVMFGWQQAIFILHYSAICFALFGLGWLGKYLMQRRKA